MDSQPLGSFQVKGIPVLDPTISRPGSSLGLRSLCSTSWTTSATGNSKSWPPPPCGGHRPPEPRWCPPPRGHGQAHPRQAGEPGIGGLMGTPRRQPLLWVGPGGALFQSRNQGCLAATHKLRFPGPNVIKLESRTSLVSGAPQGPIPSMAVPVTTSNNPATTKPSFKPPCPPGSPN